MMPKGYSQYVFGVEGFWVITPSRHGDYNTSNSNSNSNNNNNNNYFNLNNSYNNK